MTRTVWGSAALAMLPVMLAVAAVAQDKSKKTTHERLLPYWTQLELTDEQRARYDRVVREYGPRIEKLENELDDLKEKRKRELASILTVEQKRKLESIQASRGRKKKVENADAEDAKPTKTRKGVKKSDGDEPEEPVKPAKKKSKRDDG